MDTDFALQSITQLRAVPLAVAGREIGTRFEAETAAGDVLRLDRLEWRGLMARLSAAGASLRHTRLGRDMQAEGPALAVLWPAKEAGIE